MPQPRILHGSFREDGPITLYALVQHDDDRTDVIPSDVDSFDLAIYDLDGDTPDTAIWETTGLSVGFVTRQSGVGASPSGYNFKYQMAAGALDGSGTALATTGGRTYRSVITMASALHIDLDGQTVIWKMDCQSRLPT